MTALRAETTSSKVGQNDANTAVRKPWVIGSYPVGRQLKNTMLLRWYVAR